MDIIIKTEELQFSYRVAAIIINKNKILMQKNNKYNYLSLPGGKCQLKETSYDAVIREIKEEINIECEYIQTKAIIENFFYSKFNNKNIHEINIISEIKFRDEKNYNLEKYKNIEEEYQDTLWYEWVDIKELKNLEHYPLQLIEIIESDNVKHFIRKDF